MLSYINYENNYNFLYSLINKSFKESFLILNQILYQSLMN